MAELVEETPGCVLAVYAHPDDADVACGGTLARWAAAGAAVHVLVCTTGDKGSSDPSTDPGALAEQRAGEMREAAGVLGVEGRRLGHADGDLYDQRLLTGQIVGVVRSVRPDTVICPDPTAVFFGEHYFNHRDHRAVGWATLDAVAPAASQPHYFPEAGPPHLVSTVLMTGTIAPDVWVDVSSSLELKTKAILCHKSQLGEGTEWFRNVVRQRAEEGGRQAGVSHAEGFRRLRLA
ncbi:MAG: PIG-L deacetylase family protein [Acidimicrobiales bacterium]